MIVTEKEAETFLEQMGFPVIKRIYCTTARQCEDAARTIGYPVAMKVSSHQIVHKSDVGGVALNIITPAQLKKAFHHMQRIKGFEGVMVQEYVMGEFLLLGLKKDPSFGHTVAVGSGGIYTEILQDVSFRVCPLTKDDAQEMMEELKIFPVIAGVRGGVSREKEVKALILQLSQLATSYPMIEELDINPLILYHRGVTVADARLVLNEQLS